MKHSLKKVGVAAVAGATTIALAAALSGCGQSQSSNNSSSESATTYKVGICNYMDHASLNQIAESLEDQLNKLGDENNVKFEVDYQNGNADDSIISQIISDFEADQVDAMVGIATPVAMSMQTATEGSDTPVIFSAVSDPVSAGLVESADAPGANITGTSDYLNTSAVIDLMLAQNPDLKTLGLLYDAGQDSSTTAIKEVKSYAAKKGIKVVERTGTTVDELQQAATQLVNDKVDAVFTPQDNTVQNAESAIYETFIKADIPHYAGADSFALNGAFAGYGVDYANLGVETANMVYDALVNDADPAVTPVKTFENGICTINTDTCTALDYNLDDIKAAFDGLCTQIVEVTTADNFSDLDKK